jgi:CDP-paratose 2-epimerase
MNFSSSKSVAVVTGSAGLVGSETVRQFANLGMDIVGIDNDKRGMFFGPDASTFADRVALEREVRRYRHIDIDICDHASIWELFSDIGKEVAVIVHAAAQPSHDWATSDPATDFSINASATLNLLTCVRKFCPSALFIFMSTNKVYGDHVNGLPLIELASRWEIAPEHPYYSRGVDERMSIDQCAHSIFGVSKVAADLMVQEFGRLFGIPSVCFRGGCITGPSHRGTFLHGFLAHLCATSLTGRLYTIVGHKGKQVRDNLYCSDLVAAFREVFATPKVGSVYNIGGGRRTGCSVIEALSICEGLIGRPINTRLVEKPRFGDHVWWITDSSRFQKDYPNWKSTRDARTIIAELLESVEARNVNQ